MKKTKEDSTHILIQDNNLYISPNVKIIFDFIIDIEEEIQLFLGQRKKFTSIRSYFIEVYKALLTAVTKLKQSGFDFKYNLSKDPRSFAEELTPHGPPRAEMIALFAYLETLNCFDVVYKEKLLATDEVEIMKRAKNNLTSFINTYCLCNENEWYKNNVHWAKKINSGDLKKLRNSLTHFFSLGESKLCVNSEPLEKEAKRLAEGMGKGVVFIAPEDLYEIIKSAARLLLNKWSDDFESSEKKKDNDFKERISCVVSVVETTAAKIIRGEDIKFKN
jgi:hypothetical protein